MIQLNKTSICQIFFIAFLCLGTYGYASEGVVLPSWPLQSALLTESGNVIPAGSYGLATIDSPREGTLLHLRGMSGIGIASLRQSDSRNCLEFPVRFVAGDFGGTGIKVRRAQPIRIVIRSQLVAAKLAASEDVVSDMFHVSVMPGSPADDIVIQTGLEETHGFVISPGRTFLAGIFGARVKQVACSAAE